MTTIIFTFPKCFFFLHNFQQKALAFPWKARAFCLSLWGIAERYPRDSNTYGSGKDTKLSKLTFQWFRTVPCPGNLTQGRSYILVRIFWQVLRFDHHSRNTVRNCDQKNINAELFFWWKVFCREELKRVMLQPRCSLQCWYTLNL